MKNYFKYFLIIGFVLFSFYYTDKVTKISEQNNVIMASINDYAIKHDSKCIEGSITEDGIVLGLSGISVNKNMVPGDKRKPNETSGIRIGCAAMTTRGWDKDRFITCAQSIDTLINKLEEDHKA